MLFKSCIFVGCIPLTQAAETILGVYIFSRHGDRTSKSTPPATLTDLGYQQVFSSGGYYRDRYISSNASSRINGINPDLVKLSQLGISAPLDNVLMSSATAFTQGLYPPFDGTNSSQTLRNGTQVQSPLGGYQIIPIQQTTSGTGSEDAAWLQGSSNCANALVSSNNYLASDDFKMLSNSTQSFYDSQIAPMVNNTFTGSQVNYKNAYVRMSSLHITDPVSTLLTAPKSSTSSTSPASTTAASPPPTFSPPIPSPSCVPSLTRTNGISPTTAPTQSAPSPAPRLAHRSCKG